MFILIRNSGYGVSRLHDNSFPGVLPSLAKRFRGHTPLGQVLRNKWATLVAGAQFEWVMLRAGLPQVNTIIALVLGVNMVVWWAIDYWDILGLKQVPEVPTSTPLLEVRTKAEAAQAKAEAAHAKAEVAWARCKEVVEHFDNKLKENQLKLKQLAEVTAQAYKESASYPENPELKAYYITHKNTVLDLASSCDVGRGNKVGLKVGIQLGHTVGYAQGKAEVLEQVAQANSTALDQAEAALMTQAEPVKEDLSRSWLPRAMWALSALGIVIYVGANYLPSFF